MFSNKYDTQLCIKLLGSSKITKQILSGLDILILIL